MKNILITRICLALALIITVYNFFITDTPDKTATGLALILIIGAVTPSSSKQ